MIPDAAVKAAIEARYDHGADPQPYSNNRCRCGRTFPTGVELLEHVVRKELEAALWHLTAPVDRPYEHVLSDDTEPGDLG